MIKETDKPRFLKALTDKFPAMEFEYLHEGRTVIARCSCPKSDKLHKRLFLIDETSPNTMDTVMGEIEQHLK